MKFTSFSIFFFSSESHNTFFFNAIKVNVIKIVCSSQVNEYWAHRVADLKWANNLCITRILWMIYNQNIYCSLSVCVSFDFFFFSYDSISLFLTKPLVKQTIASICLALFRIFFFYFVSYRDKWMLNVRRKELAAKWIIISMLEASTRIITRIEFYLLVSFSSEQKTILVHFMRNNCIHYLKTYCFFFGK